MDWSAVAVQAVTALTPVLVLVLLWGAKLVWSKVPASLVLIAAPILGMLINFGAGWLTGHQGDFSPLVAAILGALATFLRELGTTIQTKGMNGPVSVTKIMF